MFEVIRYFLTRPANVEADEPGWLRDPLSHPVLDRMSPDELADLPLGPYRIAADRKGACREDGRLCA